MHLMEELFIACLVCSKHFVAMHCRLKFRNISKDDKSVSRKNWRRASILKYR